MEQDQHKNQFHQQISDIQGLNDLMKSLFEQLGTMLNLLTTMLTKLIQLALWNANSLEQHAEELKTFISIHNIDVMLISETHFTEKKKAIKTSQLLEVELL
jgi:hypothetical protein